MSSLMVAKCKTYPSMRKCVFNCSRLKVKRNKLESECTFFLIENSVRTRKAEDLFTTSSLYMISICFPRTLLFLLQRGSLLQGFPSDFSEDDDVPFLCHQKKLGKLCFIHNLLDQHPPSPPTAQVLSSTWKNRPHLR